MIRFEEIFQDNMILQRERPIPIRGSAGPGDRIRAEIQGKSAEAEADKEGRFVITLPALTVSEEETLTLTVLPGDETLSLNGIAVGEIWIAGGQSNMEFWMRYEAHRAEEGHSCPNPRLRFFDVPKVCYGGQLAEFDYSRMGVWRKATDDDLDYFSAVAYYFQKDLADDLEIPVGIIGCNWGGTIAAAWMDPNTVERISKPWMDWFYQVEEYQDMDAYLTAQHGKPVNDHGNPFGDYFLEGVLPRTLSTAEAMQFFVGLPRDTYEIFDDYMNHPQPQSVPGSLYEHMVRPIASFPVRGVLWYQGEGDDEFGLPEYYQTMLTGLIGDWRTLWRDEAMPFLIVQIPGFSQWLLDPPGNNLMEIRRAQERVCDTVPGTWLCSAGDAGAETDAHPKDKRDIGYRLALLARHHVYGEDILSDAPRALSAKRDGRRLILTFEHAGDGLFIKGDSVNALEVSAGGTICEYTAEAGGSELILMLQDFAGIDVSGPFTISFAQTSWYDVNLYNSAGIPAIPFTFTV